MISTGMVMFWKLIDSFYKNSWLINGFDQSVWQMMSLIRKPWIDTMMMIITKLGNWQTVATVTFLIMVWLGCKRKYKLMVAIGTTNLAGMMFVSLSKMILARERPPLGAALIRQDGFAMPSGHSYFAVVFYGLLAYFGYKWLKKKWSLWAGVGLIGAITSSRIYLGVHWATDVLSGVAASLVWLGLLVLYLERRK